jgi:NAD-dependent SIR2 family protein deacetylase
LYNLYMKKKSKKNTKKTEEKKPFNPKSKESKKPEFIYQNEIALAEKIATAKPGDCPYAIFLGAGASVSSGVASAKAMIKKWKQLLYKECKGLESKDIIDDNDFKKWQNDDEDEKGYIQWLERQRMRKGGSEYSILFSHFFQNTKERQLFIEKEIDGKKPTFGYLFLAGLIKERRFNRILTTNFDDLLNDALVKFYDERPIVCAFDSAVSGIRVASLRPKIIKLHGDFLFDNIRNIRQELKSLDLNMEEKMFEMCKDAGLIVVGYAGSDESIMAPIREMLRKNEYLNFGLHWCVRKEDDENIEIPPILEDLMKNYGDRIHIYLIKDFDYLMEIIFRTCGCSLPNDFINPAEYNLPINFHKWVDESTTVTQTPYMTHILTLIIKAAESKRDTLVVKMLNTGNLFQLGENARLEQRFDEAKQKFNECIELIDELVKEKSLSTEEKIVLYKRSCGNWLAKAQISYDKEKDNKWSDFLKSAVKAFQEGIEYLKRNIENSVKPTIKRTLYYNACCTYSVQSQYNRNITEEIREKVIEYLKEIQKLDYEGTEISDLLKDKDFEYIAENCMDIIKKEILA